jgi:hypothetical protein
MFSGEEMTDRALAKWLARQIVALEQGPKRLPALVMELCLSQYLLPVSAKGIGISDFACGWFHTGAGEARHWFRVFIRPRPVPGESVQPLLLCPAEKRCAGQLAKLGHRFFAIGVQPLAAPEGNPAPSLELTMGEWLDLEGSPRTSSPLAAAYLDDLKETVNKGISEKLGKRKQSGAGRADTASDTVVALLAAQTPEDLQLLLATRCIMNFGFATPVDADALAIDGSGNAVLLEFKRKYPSKRRFTLKGGSGSGSEIMQLALVAEAAVRELGKNPAAGKDQFNELAAREGLTKEWGRGYGLDMSHLRTLMVCAEAGIAYRYLVWDSSNETAAGNGNTRWGFRPEKLLHPSLEPLSWPVLKWRDITVADVAGITCTDGEKSGAFTRGVRIQTLFDAKRGYQMVGAPVKK